MEINNINELKNYILNNELSQEQIKEILRATLCIWVSGVYTDKKEYAEMVEEFYNKYPTIQERPLFLNQVENEDVTIKNFVEHVFD